MPEPLIRLRGVVKSYAPQGAPVLDGVDMAIRPGQTLGLSGPSGQGKSTLARLVLGLERPDAGEVLFRGRDLRGLSRAQGRVFRRQVQVVWQDPFLYLNPYFSVSDLIAEPLIVNLRRSPADAARQAARLLDQVGLPPSLAGRRPHELSGGQCQRVAMARAMACGPKLLVLDEAASGLDTVSQARMVRLLMDLRQERDLALLFISHDQALAQLLCRRRAVLSQGGLHPA